MNYGDCILPFILIAITIIFIAREYLTFRDSISAKYYLTPLITLLICLIAILGAATTGFYPYQGLIIVSLLCALAADTMLMVIEVDLLKFGLVYFLLGHVFYVAAFSIDYFFMPWNLVIAAIILIVFLSYFKLLRKKVGKLMIPVFVYFTIVSLMLYFAITGLNYGVDRTKIMVATGGVLFVISDAVLAYNAFIKKIPHSTVITWSLYAPAQLLFSLSCLD